MMATQEAHVRFNDAQAYERFMGRWSRAVGEKFLTWLAPPDKAAWLDVGSGTGAFTELILKSCAPASIIGVDPAPAQVEHAKSHVTAPNVEFRAGTAVYLPFRIDQFDVVVSALVIHFIPDRAKGFKEMLRVAKPGGLIAGYTWERKGSEIIGAPYGTMARALMEIGADLTLSPAIPEAMPDALRAAMQTAGYKDIEITTIEAEASYTNFEDYWAAQTPEFAPTGKTAAALSGAQRDKLHAVLRKTLPTATDGSIRYTARSTAFKAGKP
jgi:SAM-dependent methyltransferase